MRHVIVIIRSGQELTMVLLIIRKSDFQTHTYYVFIIHHYITYNDKTVSGVQNVFFRRKKKIFCSPTIIKYKSITILP